MSQTCPAITLKYGPSEAMAVILSLESGACVYLRRNVDVCSGCDMSS
jgi:hypothetical protein